MIVFHRLPRLGGNRREKGAALVTVVLLMMLLMVTCGAIILITGLSNSTTIDAVAEKQALGAVLSQLRAEGMSLLLVEHDMDFVMTLTDRIVVVEFGIKLTEGTPGQVREDPAVRAAYLGVEH